MRALLGAARGRSSLDPKGYAHSDAVNYAAPTAAAKTRAKNAPI